MGFCEHCDDASVSTKCWGISRLAEKQTFQECILYSEQATRWNVRISLGSTDFCLLQNALTRSGNKGASHSMGTGIISPRVKASRL